jgi:lipoprotein-releasing system permease protein
MIWGNIAGVGLITLQHFFHLVPLDKESYYVDYVPVSFNLLHILMINAGTFLICLLMVMIPGYIIGKITPVKAIRYQ